ncbi:hypothetical protein EIP86_008256 [Pleurotus ostreatoroseus]|nr:hypothetical protein EIP86_008256 [Pleurotus ostreatoroseus]
MSLSLPINLPSAAEPRALGPTKRRPTACGRSSRRPGEPHRSVTWKHVRSPNPAFGLARPSKPHVDDRGRFAPDRRRRRPPPRDAAPPARPWTHQPAGDHRPRSHPPADAGVGLLETETRARRDPSGEPPKARRSPSSNAPPPRTTTKTCVAASPCDSQAKDEDAAALIERAHRCWRIKGRRAGRTTGTHPIHPHKAIETLIMPSPSTTDPARPPSAAHSGPLVVDLRAVGSPVHPVSSFAFVRVEPSIYMPGDSARYLLGKKTANLAHPDARRTEPVTLALSGRLARDRDARFDTASSISHTSVTLWLEELPDVHSHVEWQHAAAVLQELLRLSGEAVDTSSAFAIDANGAMKFRLHGMRLHTGADDIEGFSVFDHDGHETVIPDASRLPYDEELTAHFRVLCHESDSHSPEPPFPCILFLLRKLKRGRMD